MTVGGEIVDNTSKRNDWSHFTIKHSENLYIYISHHQENTQYCLYSPDDVLIVQNLYRDSLSVLLWHVTNRSFLKCNNIFLFNLIRQCFYHLLSVLNPWLQISSKAFYVCKQGILWNMTPSNIKWLLPMLHLFKIIFIFLLYYFQKSEFKLRNFHVLWFQIIILTTSICLTNLIVVLFEMSN